MPTKVRPSAVMTRIFSGKSAVSKKWLLMTCGIGVPTVDKGLQGHRVPDRKVEPGLHLWLQCRESALQKIRYRLCSAVRAF